MKKSIISIFVALLAFTAMSFTVAGDVTCDSCGGSGRVICSSCNGNPSCPCIKCGGSGQVEYNGITNECIVCDGTGRNECRTCDGKGQVLCTRCLGRGVIHVPGGE